MLEYARNEKSHVTLMSVMGQKFLSHLKSHFETGIPVSLEQAF